MERSHLAIDDKAILAIWRNHAGLPQAASR